jgi:tetratricopeptide (TPR) repeat protein
MPLPTDRYGNPLTTDEATASLYRNASDCLLAAGASIIETARTVTANDPHFALGHILEARCLATYGHGTAAMAALARAREHTPRATIRERGHVYALGLVVEGRAADALDAVKAHLSVFPRDALVLQPATATFGLIGFSGRIDRESELLALMDFYAPHYGDDWWFNSIHAFVEAEAGRIESAETRVHAALADNAQNGNGAHALAHVLYEAGRDKDASVFLDNWLSTYPSGALLRTHLAWHSALALLRLGQFDAAWRRFQDDFAIHVQPAPPLNVLTDISSWLWRAERVEGQARAEEWKALSEWVAANFAKPGVAFGDAHRALLHSKVGDVDALHSLIASCAASDRIAMQVVAKVGAGFAAAVRGDTAESARWFAEAEPELVRVGGSAAQRDLFIATQFEMLDASGRESDAQALLQRRSRASKG